MKKEIQVSRDELEIIFDEKVRSDLNSDWENIESAKSHVIVGASSIARMAVRESFDAGYALGLEQAEGLLKALEFYAEFSNWYGEFKNRGNNHFTDFSRSDLEQFDGHMICGKRARQAVAKFKTR